MFGNFVSLFVIVLRLGNECRTPTCCYFSFNSCPPGAEPRRPQQLFCTPRARVWCSGGCWCQKSVCHGASTSLLRPASRNVLLFSSSDSRPSPSCFERSPSYYFIIFYCLAQTAAPAKPFAAASTNFMGTTAGLAAGNSFGTPSTFNLGTLSTLGTSSTNSAFSTGSLSGAPAVAAAATATTGTGALPFTSGTTSTSSWMNGFGGMSVHVLRWARTSGA